MPRPRIAMRKIREVLRLGLGEGFSPRQVAASPRRCPGITVRRYLERAHLAGVSWPLPEGMDDQQVERWLFASPPPPSMTRPLPDRAVVHQELRRKDVTLQLLWLEYCEEGAPDGYQYSRSAIATGRGSGTSTWSCGRSTGPARSCSWIGPGARSRSSTRSPG
jgi:hypothetical protein